MDRLTTTFEDQRFHDFLLEKIETGLKLADVVDFIADTFEPEDVYDADRLEEWWKATR